MNKHAKENLRDIIHMAKDKSANQYFMNTGRHPTDDIRTSRTSYLIY